MQHMDLEIRKQINSLAWAGHCLAKIARTVGRHFSTIRNEFLNHRVESDKGRGCSNRLCAHFDECTKTTNVGFDVRMRKNLPKCFERCRDFREAVCDKLNRPPFVCNGCDALKSCPMKKKFYIPDVAQEQYGATLRLSRTGAHPSAEEFAEMDAILSPCIRRGQSPMAVMAAHPKVFGRYSKSAVYGWLQKMHFSAKAHETPFAGRQKKHGKKPVTKTDAKCRVGRTILDMRDWLAAHEGQRVTCELDTVIGSVGGKVLFTMILRDTGLSLVFLRKRKSSQTCTRIFNALWEAAGPELFRELFGNTLTDNGPEFSDPTMIENYRPDPEHNPTKLLPRGVRMWFADAYCSSQKPHIERFHNDLRRIFQKGMPFDHLSQDEVTLAVSHLNSYPREATDWKAPYDRFVEKHGDAGKAFLDKLGIVRIPAGQVTLLPSLLGEKHQKIADEAVLRKNRVDPGKESGAGKG